MTNDSSPVRLPQGVRDFLPRAAARRRAIAERLLEAFAAWGYERLITPVFECADVLERGLGADARAAALRFVEPGSGEVVALRPDFTPQVARIAATRLADIEGPLRLCYEGAVNRLTSPSRGPLAQREILQAGVELIGAGAGGPDADAEALAVAAAALATIGLPAQLDVGHVAPARAVLEAIDDPAARAALALALGKKDKAQVARAAALPAMNGLAKLAVALCDLWGPVDEVLARAKALPWPDSVATALGELERAVASARRLAPEARFTADLGELRGFEYYTGLRFAGYARGAGDAVLRGGRYDTLVGRYGRAARAVGFAVDIEAIAQAQRAAQVSAPAPTPGVLVIGADREAAGRIAQALRATGLRAAVDLVGGDPTERRRYAGEVGWTHVLAVDAASAYAVDGGDPIAVASAAIAAASHGDAALLRALFA